MVVKLSNAKASNRLFNAITQFMLQVNEVEEQFVKATQNNMLRIQNRMLSLINETPSLFRDPVYFSNSLTQELMRDLLGHSAQIVDGYKEFSVASSRALPLFMSKSLTRRERSSLSREQVLVGDQRFEISPFDLDDVESPESEDEEDDEREFDPRLDGLFFGLTDQEAEVFIIVFMNSLMTMRQQFEALAIKSSYEFQSRLNSELAMNMVDFTTGVTGSTGTGQVEMDEMIRKTGRKVVKSSLYGGRGISMVKNNIVRNMTNLTKTQIQAIINGIISETGKKNGQKISGFMWSNLLDGHLVCKRCAALHKRFYPIKSDGTVANPPIPLHPVCQCYLVPLMKKKQGVESVRTARPDMPQFKDWFDGQSDKYKIKVLGKKGYELYQNGRLSFKNFVQFRHKVPVRARTLKSLEGLLR